MDGGRLLLLLASCDVQSATQLAAASMLGVPETLRQLQRLVDQGFVVAADDAEGVTVYQLRPRELREEGEDPTQRLLVVENDTVLRDVVVRVLEHEEYALIAVSKPTDAVTLLQQVSFDLVITDGFSGTPNAVFVNSMDVLHNAGATPVALFTAHRLDLDAVQAAGFRDLIAKPFSVETLWGQVRVLLRDREPHP